MKIDDAIQMLKSYAGMSHKIGDNQGRPKLDQAIDIVLEELQKEKTKNIDIGQYIARDVIENKWREYVVKTHIQYPENVDDFLEAIRCCGRVEAYEELLDMINLRNDIENIKDKLNSNMVLFEKHNMDNTNTYAMLRAEVDSLSEIVDELDKKDNQINWLINTMWDEIKERGGCIFNKKRLVNTCIGLDKCDICIRHCINTELESKE